MSAGCRPSGGALGGASGPRLTPVFPPDMSEGTVGDMAALGITESFQVKRQVLLSASEAAEMILRVDDVIKAAPRSVGHLDPPGPGAQVSKVQLSLQEEGPRPPPLLRGGRG